MKELMNERYKDMKNKIVLMIVAVALVALPTMAQFTEPERPQTTFQSTSTMTPSGSQYSSQVTGVGATDVNYAGTTTEGNSSSRGHGPRRIDVYTPTTDPNAPIGDAVLPFTLLSMVAAGVVYLRRRKQQA